MSIEQILERTSRFSLSRRVSFSAASALTAASNLASVSFSISSTGILSIFVAPCLKDEFRLFIKSISSFGTSSSSEISSTLPSSDSPYLPNSKSIPSSDSSSYSWIDEMRDSESSSSSGMS